MRVEIISNNDENFTLDVEPSLPTLEEVTELVENIPTRQPIPAPLENPKGLGWFEGTSWGVNK